MNGVSACSYDSRGVRRGPSRGDRGWVTVEMAAGSLLVAAMACLLGWLGGILALQLRVTDAAAQVARQEARGDAAAVAAAKSAAPEGSVFEVSRAEGRVQVVVRCTPRSALPWLPAPAVSSSATVQEEPGAK